MERSMEKLWLKNYQNGVPSEIEPDKFNSLVEIFNLSCQKYSDNIAYSNYGTEITYKQLEAYSRYFSAFLINELGLKKGERFALMLPNLLQYPIALFGALRAGLIIVNVNPLFTTRELKQEIDDSGASTILVLENFAHTVENILPSDTLQNIIITKISDLHKFPKNYLIGFVNKHIHKNVKSYNIKNYYSFSSALSSGAKYNFSDVNVNSQDIAFLQYTGGTTGQFKAAELTHRNIIANLEQTSAWTKPVLQEGTEIVITALPMYHIFSLTANCLLYLKIGAKNILITNPRDIKSFVKVLKKNIFTCITGVNTLFNALLHNETFKNINFTYLKITLGGGMQVQKIVAEKWKKVTGCALLEAYGLTETSPAVAINPLDSKNYNGSVGLPIPSTDISIRSETGEEVPLLQPGELWVKGPQVMKRYWKNEPETRRVIIDGWLRTGDVAKVDKEGYLYIIDRIKDLILVSGFNVYPNEIEDVLVSHPSVLEAGVVGEKNFEGNEIVVAYVVLKNSDITEIQLKEYCHQNLTNYKVPKKIIFLQSLPKSNVGKVLRKELRKLQLQTTV